MKAVSLEIEATKLIAQNEIAEAEATATINRIKTEMEAYSIIKKAEAEAKANKLIAESISDDMIQWHKTEIMLNAMNRWDGKLPMLSGQNPLSFLNLSSIFEPLTRS